MIFCTKVIWSRAGEGRQRTGHSTTAQRSYQPAAAPVGLSALHRWRLHWRRSDQMLPEKTASLSFHMKHDAFVKTKGISGRGKSFVSPARRSAPCRAFAASRSSRRGSEPPPPASPARRGCCGRALPASSARRRSCLGRRYSPRRSLQCDRNALCDQHTFLTFVCPEPVLVNE